MPLKILFQNSEIVFVDKPSGFHVHPPEDSRHKIPQGKSCLHLLRDQLGQWVYPFHRLDGATSGALGFALSSEAAAKWSLLWRTPEVTKTYLCVVRGRMSEKVTIDYPLKSLETGELKDCVSVFDPLASIELPFAVGRYPTSRYSLVKVQIETGRQHQIRRHAAHISHPLIGDTIYGDGKHNRFFRSQFNQSELYLRSWKIETPEFSVTAPWKSRWHQCFDLFGLCAFR